MANSLLATPIGWLWISTDDQGRLSSLQRVSLPGEPPPAELAGSTAPDTASSAVEAQLQEYFAGQRHTFEIELNLLGSPFQRSVWAALCEVGYGRTVSYGQLATAAGRPAAARAIGGAVGRNPVCIVVPCHRVMGADGSLTGYSGGLDMKEFLLDLEGVRPLSGSGQARIDR